MSDHDKFYIVSMVLFYILGWISAVRSAHALDKREAARSQILQDPTSIVNEYDYSVQDNRS